MVDCVVQLGTFLCWWLQSEGQGLDRMHALKMYASLFLRTEKKTNIYKFNLMNAGKIWKCRERFNFHPWVVITVLHIGDESQ